MLTDPFGTNVITRAIIGCGVRVHSVVGPGVYESVYSECLQYELKAERLSYETNREAPIVYKGTRLKSRFYIDIVVEGIVIVELKAVVALAEIHTRQVLTQLKLTDLPVGLLLNFNVVTLTQGGVKRVVNPNYKAPSRHRDQSDRVVGTHEDRQQRRETALQAARCANADEPSHDQPEIEAAGVDRVCVRPSP